MAANDNLTETLRRLAVLVAENGLAELTVEEGGLKITVKGAVTVAALPPVSPSEDVVSSRASTARPAPLPPSSARVRPSTRIACPSPMVGLFYQSPSPDSPPFVAVGDIIQIGQTIGLIEAMKVYSEVPSEVGGRVVEVVAADGKLVQQGQPLLYVEPQ